jgi:hypothetical protein
MAMTTSGRRLQPEAALEGREARLRRLSEEVRAGRYRPDLDRLVLCMVARSAALSGGLPLDGWPAC